MFSDFFKARSPASIVAGQMPLPMLPIAMSTAPTCVRGVRRPTIAFDRLPASTARYALDRSQPGQLARQLSTSTSLVRKM